ncbi:MAG: putative toxin-antitoxin system toxin component, PIN family [Thermoguttaceae bacterium]|jgi:putative PIN family toxin of toxin-antitoxin system
MRIVLDTNVLVSGLLNPFGAPGRIVALLAAGELTLCFDTRILAEYREVLGRPFLQLRSDEIEAMMEQITAVGEPLATRPLRGRLPDPDDAMFLEAAIAGGAEYLVTGNLKHYPVRCRQGVAVATPVRFVEIIQGSSK